MNVYITRINGSALEDYSQYIQNMTAGIAYKLGIKEMGIYRYDADPESEESLNVRMDGIIAGINRGDLVICQFPTGNGLKFEWSLVDHLKAYGGRVAILVHDLEPLSHEEKSSMLGGTVDLYNQAEVLIVPSLSMRQFLLENKIRKNMKFVIQEMRDYVVDDILFSNPEFRDVYAYLFAERFEKIDFDEVPGEIARSRFGLIWYKDECERRYMGYAIPFLMSKAVALGMPVIVPEGIANQAMIEANHLGIVAASIDDAVAKINDISEAEYQEYLSGVEQFSPALRNGYYTEKSILEAMLAFYRKDADKLS